MNSGARPWFGAAEAARSLPIDQIVTRLRSVIGVRVVAYVGGVTTTSKVSAWADGHETPDAATAVRLRTDHFPVQATYTLGDPACIASPRVESIIHTAGG